MYTGVGLNIEGCIRNRLYYSISPEGNLKNKTKSKMSFGSTPTHHNDDFGNFQGYKVVCPNITKTLVYDLPYKFTSVRRKWSPPQRELKLKLSFLSKNKDRPTHVERDPGFERHTTHRSE